MSKLKRIAIFCGSSTGNQDAYKHATLALVRLLHKQGAGMVYGGGSIGLMGIAADEMMLLGGEVIGIIPQKIYDWEVGHKGITKLEVVKDMHERKARMAELSDGFIALPGGFGTMEEIIEVITWQILGYHQKPCAFLDVDGFYQPLFQFFDHAQAQGFIKSKYINNLLMEANPELLMRKLWDQLAD